MRWSAALTGRVLAVLSVVIAGVASARPFQIEQCKVELVAPWAPKGNEAHEPRGGVLRIFAALSQRLAISMYPPSPESERISADNDPIVLRVRLPDGRKKIVAITESGPGGRKVCVADIVVPAGALTAPAERIAASLTWMH